MSPCHSYNTDITSLGVAHLFRNNVWKLHGLPEEVISDQETQFVLNFMQGLNQLLGIKVAASMAYYPQTESQTKHVNQQIKQFLQLFINQRQDDWFEWVEYSL